MLKTSLRGSKIIRKIPSGDIKNWFEMVIETVCNSRLGVGQNPAALDLVHTGHVTGCAASSSRKMPSISWPGGKPSWGGMVQNHMGLEMASTLVHPHNGDWGIPLFRQAWPSAASGLSSQSPRGRCLSNMKPQRNPLEEDLPTESWDFTKTCWAFPQHCQESRK